MKLDVPYIQLPDAPASLAENVLALLTEEDWFGLDYRKTMVTHTGEGSYDSLLIRHSPSYTNEGIRNMPMYDKYEAVVLDYVEWLKQYYEVEDFVCFFARLSPHHNIAMHQDAPTPFLADIHRIHFPIMTNDDCFYQFDEGEVQMALNSVYEIDNQRNHGVDNRGDTARIHLVINIYGERKPL